MLLRYTMAITHTASLPMADARKIIDEIKDIDLGDGVALFQQVMLLLHMRLSTNISCCWRIALSVSSHTILRQSWEKIKAEQVHHTRPLAEG